MKIDLVLKLTTLLNL